MEYDEALGRWAAEKTGMNPEGWGSLSVYLDLNPGYACCGGTDPDCYCSFAESPSVELVVRQNGVAMYSDRNMDFVQTVREIFEVANA